MSEARDKMAEIREDLEKLESKAGGFTAGDAERFDNLMRGFENAETAHEALRSEWTKAMNAGMATGEIEVHGSPKYNRETGEMENSATGKPIFSTYVGGVRNLDPFEGAITSELAMRFTKSEVEDRAKVAIEKSPIMTDAAKQEATVTLERQDPDGLIAGWQLIGGNPDYISAFSQKMSGNDDLNREEIAALRAAREYRAGSLTDSAGGYAVPAPIDPNWSIAIGDGGYANEVSMAARTVHITNDVWNGVGLSAISPSWDTEGTEVSDDFPTVSQPTVPVHSLKSFAPASVELVMDAADLAQQLVAGFAYAFAAEEAEKVITGSGTDQPTGIVTACLAASTTTVVNATTDLTFGLVDVYNMYEGLSPRHRDAAKWAANPIIQSEIRQFATDAATYSHSGDLREKLAQFILGRPVLSASAMDSSAGTDSEILIFANWDQFVIARRTPSLVIEHVPVVVGSSAGRPTFQRGWTAFTRWGSDLIDAEAARVLQT